MHQSRILVNFLLFEDFHMHRFCGWRGVPRLCCSFSPAMHVTFRSQRGELSLHTLPGRPRPSDTVRVTYYLRCAHRWLPTQCASHFERRACWLWLWCRLLAARHSESRSRCVWICCNVTHSPVAATATQFDTQHVYFEHGLVWHNRSPARWSRATDLGPQLSLC